MKSTEIIQRFIVVFIISVVVSSISFAQQDKAKQEEVKIKTSAYSWMCKNKIEFNLKEKQGVSDAELDLKTQVVTVKYDPKKIDTAQIKKSIEQLGYEAKILDKDSSKEEDSKR